MKRIAALLLISTLIAGAAAVASPPNSQGATLKRQLNECMAKRMGANRTLSYNDAMRACKELLQPGKESLASINQVQPAANNR
jgi:hypothetical protein